MGNNAGHKGTRSEMIADSGQRGKIFATVCTVGVTSCLGGPPLGGQHEPSVN
jgi:hypothetical protein